MQSLVVNEIFYSIQGESKTVGFPTIFIRLTGCPIRCTYCDTAYAFNEGQRMSLADILDRVDKMTAKYITLTGGEPLAQPGTRTLIKELCKKGYEVSIETGGMVSIADIDERATIVLDIKTPGSHESHNNLLSNFDRLKKNDQIKFVICDESDFHWAMKIIDQYSLLDKSEVIVSPSYLEISEQELAELVLNSKKAIRMQIQLHKLLWSDKRGK